MRDRCDVVPVTLRRDLIPAGAFVGAWRSLVARLLWEQEAPGSNPGAPTTTASRVGIGSSGHSLRQSSLPNRHCNPIKKTLRRARNLLLPAPTVPHAQHRSW